MMSELAIPVYYVVSRSLPIEEVGWVLRCLRITPVKCAVISNVHDTEIAMQLSEDVVLVSTDEAAKAAALTIAEATGMPPVVIGESEFFDAVYSNGTSEAVANRC